MPNRPAPDSVGRGSGGSPQVPASRPASLADLPFELPHGFLGLEGPEATLEGARAVILPVPYESTTSYGGGTRNGPRAIIEASRFIELYDQELDEEPGRHGVHTLPALELTRAGSTQAMAELEEAYGDFLAGIGDRFPVMLGGEHAVSAPAIRATAAHLAGREAARVEAGETGGDAAGKTASRSKGDGVPGKDHPRLSVLQLDAHADLRDGYEGAPWSHASFAYRCLDVADFVQVGIRAVCSEEVDVMRDREGIHVTWADQMWEDDAWMEPALEALGPQVYLTVDVDYFDPTLVPSTGTPEPGGGDWYRTLRFLRRVFQEREVVGMDVVELAPTPGLHAPDFLVAKLIYKLLGYRWEVDG
jgi:agmatinase